MWIIVGGVVGVVLLTCATNKCQSLLKVGTALAETLKDKYLGDKPKKIEIVDLNKKSLLVYEEIAFLATKTHHHYDILYFHSDSEELNLKASTHNINPINYIKQIVSMSVIRHGQYLASIPFRPNDLGYNTLFVSIKKMNDNLHSVYKFMADEYINLADIINRYEQDSKENEAVCELAEAYD